MRTYSHKYEGKKREFRRLGLSDIFEIQRILIEMFEGAELQRTALNLDFSQEGLMGILQFLAKGMDFCETRMTNWLKSLFDEPLKDDEMITLTGLADIIEMIMSHPDKKYFLESVRGLMPQIEEMEQEIFPAPQ